MVRAIFAALLAAGLAGCATTAKNTLDPAKREALRIDSVELGFAGDAVISWMDAVDEFKRNGVVDTPVARRTFLEKKATPHIKAALDAEIPPAFRGTEPARLKILVRGISVAPVALRLIVGGSYSIKADIQVIDTKTGQVLIDAPNFNGVAQGGAGPLQVLVEQAFPDPIDRVSRVFARALRSWLQTGLAFASG